MVKGWRRRYIIFQIYSAKNLQFEKHDVLNVLFKTILKLFGEIGASLLNFNLIYHDSVKGRGIIRCNHDKVCWLRAAAAFISDINGTPITFHILKVTGSIRRAKEILNSLPSSKVLGDEEAVPGV
ncbi:MAG TPA: hypothetical protein ENG81_04745 [Candidatus Bathyarchaeota archaeon]|nr:hypothetical protein [Candidatus Verstraetearchaeota archaeon]RLE55533.1 MAG: hypothetical protein DRJ30_03520 [Candidatus Verstraetearchaeota archaeon]HDO20805.1 hypothetical protein [Candidatus Bathyarchaeota archaeon]